MIPRCLTLRLATILALGATPAPPAFAAAQPAANAAEKPAVPAAPTGTPKSRPFRMGFTPFPYALTVEAVETVGRLVRDNADIVSVHYEGVPWKEAHLGEPYHQKILDDWKRHLDAKPANGRVFLSLSPLNNGRSGIAGYRAASENLPLPDSLAGKALDDPLIVKAYLDYCRQGIRYFKPDYLAIGIEVNELFHHNAALWPAYTNLHSQVYRSLKTEHPQLPVCVTFTLHNLLNPDWKDRDEMLSAAKALMSDSDFVAISFYPFMALLGDRMQESLDWLRTHFDTFKKPYIFSETGQPAEPVVLKSRNFTIPANPNQQAEVLAHMLAFSQERNVEFLIWFLPRDYDNLWEAIRPTAPEFFGVWRDCGLWDGAGLERPAFRVWREYVTRPRTTRSAQ